MIAGIRMEPKTLPNPSKTHKTTIKLASGCLLGDFGSQITPRSVRRCQPQIGGLHQNRHLERNKLSEGRFWVHLKIENGSKTDLLPLDWCFEPLKMRSGEGSGKVSKNEMKLIEKARCWKGKIVSKCATHKHPHKHTHTHTHTQKNKHTNIQPRRHPTAQTHKSTNI